MFPGVKPKEIAKAIKNRINNVRPSLPKVTSTSMDSFGKFTIIFEEEIMLPAKIDQHLFDHLFEV